jgi:glycosyltransferase involved in cell wall biosynthesis
LDERGLMSEYNLKSKGNCDDMPFVSVIIPVFNDVEALKKCLNALDRQTYPKDRYEVIVVDNGSEPPVDPSITNICANLQLICHPLGGSYAARNAGIKHANADVFGFIDSDCLPCSEWLEEGVKALAGQGWDVVIGGDVRISYGDPEKPTYPELYEAVFAFNQKHYVEK